MTIARTVIKRVNQTIKYVVSLFQPSLELPIVSVTKKIARIIGLTHAAVVSAFLLLVSFIIKPINVLLD